MIEYFYQWYVYFTQKRAYEKELIRKNKEEALAAERILRRKAAEQKRIDEEARQAARQWQYDQQAKEEAELDEISNGHWLPDENKWAPRNMHEDDYRLFEVGDMVAESHLYKRISNNQNGFLGRVTKMTRDENNDIILHLDILNRDDMTSGKVSQFFCQHMRPATKREVKEYG